MEVYAAQESLVPHYDHYGYNPGGVSDMARPEGAISYSDDIFFHCEPRPGFQVDAKTVNGEAGCADEENREFATDTPVSATVTTEEQPTLEVEIEVEGMDVEPVVAATLLGNPSEGFLRRDLRMYGGYGTDCSIWSNAQWLQNKAMDR